MSESGTALGWIGGGVDGWQTGGAPSYARSDLRSFDCPHGIAVDQAGNMYVADWGNNRICKWDNAGNALGWIGDGKTGWNIALGATSSNDYQYFANPVGIYINNVGEIYVADHGNHRICKWDCNGNAIGWIGSGNQGWQTISGNGFGTDLYSFHYPFAIVGDNFGYLYIADTYNQRIVKWQD